MRRLADDANTNNKLGDLGVCDGVTNVLMAQIANINVIERCLFLIGLLATNENNRKKLGSNGICESILMAMKEHKNVSLVVVSGCRAIVSLCAHNTENRDRFLFAQGKKLVYDLSVNTSANEQARQDAKEAMRVL